MNLGLLFDLDGTMADTDPAHFAAFNALLGESGRSLTPDAFRVEVMGKSNAAIMQRLFPDLDASRHAALADHKEALFRSLCPTIEPLPGLLELLDEAVRHGVPVGVVTNAPRLNAEHMLRALGAAHLLPTVVVGEEIARGKPDPLPYLTGLERLPCDAARAIAFEDSITGITAASGAGIYTVGLTTSLDADTLLAAGADMAVPDYRDPRLLALFADALQGKAIHRRPTGG